MGGPDLSNNIPEAQKEENKRKRAEQDRLAAEESKRVEEEVRIVAQENELAPLNKALRDEVDFLNKKFTSTSKIGGRGLF